MKNIILLLTILAFSHKAFTQKSETTMEYELLRSSSLESVGGDLVIIDDDFPNRLQQCPRNSFNLTVLFQGGSPQTIFIKVDNRGEENNCVTLSIETTSGLQKIDVASNDQTGVLKFDKVKRAFLSITKGKITSDTPILKSTGKATIWF